MKTHPFLIYLFAITFIASSCNKEKTCSKTAQTTELNAEKKTVVAGWPIRLSTPDDVYDQYDFHWKGPQVDVVKDKTDGQRSLYTIESSTFQDAGTYTVQVMDGKCIKKTASIQITVIEPPSAPCSVQNNHTTSSAIAGVGGITYTSVNTYTQFPPAYTIEATEGLNQALTFRFQTGGTPKFGVYTSSGESGAVEDIEKVSVVISAGLNQFIMKPGFEVYVTWAGTQRCLAFCDAEFYNPLTSDPIIISGSITAP